MALFVVCAVYWEKILLIWGTVILLRCFFDWRTQWKTEQKEIAMNKVLEEAEFKKKDTQRQIQSNEIVPAEFREI